MDPFTRSSLIFIACAVCLTYTITAAIPIVDLSEDDVDSFYAESCKLCLLFSDLQACEVCNLELPEEAMPEKRSPLVHPLLRGMYTKRSSYTPYYNPLFRGSYLKKSYTSPQNVYHPFLRGGYRGPTLPVRSNLNYNVDDDTK